MLLCELFDDSPLEVTDELKSALMDILTPMVASKVPFVTVQQVIDKMREMNTGMSIDRTLIFNLLDPDQVKMVKKIEGDRIYLSQPMPTDREVGEDDAEKEAEHVSDMAQKQAQQNMGGAK